MAIYTLDVLSAAPSDGVPLKDLGIRLNVPKWSDPPTNSILTTNYSLSAQGITQQDIQASVQLQSAITAGYITFYQDAIPVTAVTDFQQKSDSLTSISALATLGFLVQSASGSYLARSLTAASSKISISNGNGVSGNPSINVVENQLVVDNMTTAITGILKGDTGAIIQAQPGTDFVEPNGVIVSGTATKITYDSKGLVTAGVAATTADINDSTNRRYMTDAQQTIVGTIATLGTANQVLRMNAGGSAVRYGAIDVSSSSAITGILQSASMPALTGDVTNTAGTVATTIANNAVNDAKIASHTSSKITITAKGQLNSAIVYTDQTNTYGAFDQIFPNSRLLIQNPAATFNYTIAGSAITAARTLTLPLTRQAETLAVVPQVSFSTPANPTGTNSATGVMMGLAASITPQVTGRIKIYVTGTIVSNNNAGAGGARIRYGTGTAPANGAALTGTAIGNPANFIQGSANDSTPFALVGYVTGLTAGTAHWIDVSVNTNGTGTTTISSITILAEEV